MALPISSQAKYWGIAAAVFFLFFWLLGDVMMPFLAGAAVAYFLDPVADRLERAGLSRVMATAVISVVATLIVILLMLSLIPTLVSQLTALINAAPELFNTAQKFLLERFPELQDRTSTIRQSLTQIGQAIQARGGELANSVLASAMSFIGGIVFLVIVPVVAFYFLLDWDRMVARIDALLPRDHAPVIRRLAREIDTALSGFIRGQMSVCLILGTFYSIALMVAGLNYGLLVGAFAGAITFIPYIGSITGGILAIGLALFQFWGDWVSIGIVAGIFAFGQFVEGNIISPKLVGNSVGLHPLWLIFALSAFGALFGFAGMLVAVPVAAAIGVLIRFTIERYKESQLYRGGAPKVITTLKEDEKVLIVKAEFRDKP
ncbi:MAG: AI-2E family transporter [Paracoccaceae bacterium]